MRHIFLFSTVDSYSAELIVRQLLEYDRQSHDEITMFINSPGGYVTQLFSIIDAMDLVSSPIRTVVIGQAASCASVIAAYGDTRLISEKSEFMLHEVWDLMVGSYNDMQENIERMEMMQNKLLGILSKATGKTVDELNAVIKKNDAYYSAEQAIAFGLADRIIRANEAGSYKLSEGINVEGSEIIYKEQGLSEVEILKTGEFNHPSYGNVVVSDSTLNQMCENFKRRVRGIDISFDYTHDNENGEQPAAFWVKSLEVKDKGDCKVLTAQAEFTPKGKKAIQEKEYKYASADFCIDYVNETGKHFAYVLRGGTLTNRPFIKEMNPIKLSEIKHFKKEIKKMNKEQLIAELKSQGLDVMAMQTQNGELTAKITELQAKVSELAALPAQKEAEIKVLNTKICEMNETIVKEGKEKSFDALMSAGKVVPAQKESIMALVGKAEDMDKFYATAPVVVKTKASGNGGEGDDQVLDEAELAVVNAGIKTKEEIIAGRKIQPKAKK